ncbi:MAG TPA: ABC transporter substrate-binding protein [Chitinophagaceae bacterium]|nr:ABC transporter substrate-binding protein [Chitinophagaceae bacterium]
MNKSIKIGFLSPYSGVYPFYAQHLTAGMMVGMDKDPSRQTEIQIIPAYTRMGGAKQNEEAARQLLFFDQVDILSGLVSYLSVTPLIPLLESRKKIGFFFDMGEYIPYFPYLSPHVFYCSQQLWQSEYALGRWARQTFGTGMMVTPIYEAGYHLDKAFRKGTLAAGQGGDMMQHILPFDEGDPGRLDLTSFFEEVSRIRPAYVHAIFGGPMGARFLQQWYDSDYHCRIPLLVNETMAYDDMLEDIAHLGLEMYAPSMWSHGSEEPRNRAFIKTFETLTGQNANIYALMGYEVGLVLKELWPELVKRDWETVKTLLQKKVILGPRGQKSFYPASGFALPEIDIVRIKTEGSRIHRMIVDRGRGLRHDASEFEEIHRECVTGWQNPFLCI